MRPLDSPDDGGQGAGSSEPNAACAEGGGITETEVSWFTYDEFSTVGWARREDAQEDAEVAEGST
jgi:hypothetical protein